MPRLVALAIRFEQLVRDGTVSDYAELARLGHVMRARMSQIMNLLNLAPDIQEALLFLPEVVGGKDLFTERGLRKIVANVSWKKQRIVWRNVKLSDASESSARHSQSVPCRELH